MGKHKELQTNMEDLLELYVRMWVKDQVPPTLHDLAREMGIHHNTCRHWLHELAGQGKCTFHVDKKVILSVPGVKVQDTRGFQWPFTEPTEEMKKDWVLYGEWIGLIEKRFLQGEDNG